ncbi:hypothetical protein ZIOFF_070015 [Zingiber officinale]|uniref:Uncharacterized protein n=1 Tax=Zingiber officinale TaxID=94328 RepID=A0A8J5EV96_ZINOF|nr:hypothetical protein ZIOFF_070015 [Zingiber officinale]
MPKTFMLEVGCLVDGAAKVRDQIHCKLLKEQIKAKENGYSDVLYLDSTHKKYLEEVSSCNIYVAKIVFWSISSLHISILFPPLLLLDAQVEECAVLVDEVLDAHEVFCTGTAVVVSPVGSIMILLKHGNT